MITNYKLFESKQVGILYHFTNLISLYSILKTNSLETYRTVDDNDNLKNSYNIKGSLYYISFTRNKNFHKIPQLNMEHPITCRLTIDGDKLSNKYKIYPVDFFNDYDEEYNTEDEECITTQSSQGLVNIKNYILKIEIPTLDNFKHEIIKGLMCNYYAYRKKLEEICSEFGRGKEYEYFYQGFNTNDEDDFIKSRGFKNFTKNLYKEITHTLKHDNYL
jgi:hypothetical protein